MIALLPPSTNDQYRGARVSVWALGLAALVTLGPGAREEPQSDRPGPLRPVE